MPELRAYLNTNGRIYSVRKYDMPSAVVQIDGVGLCKRLNLGLIVEDKALTAYADQSGFPTLKDWLAVVYGTFIVKGYPMYLYEVTKGVE